MPWIWSTTKIVAKMFDREFSRVYIQSIGNATTAEEKGNGK